MRAQKFHVFVAIPVFKLDSSRDNRCYLLHRFCRSTKQLSESLWIVHTACNVRCNVYTYRHLMFYNGHGEKLT